MKKRILALLLCLILTTTVSTVPAFAENTMTVEEQVQMTFPDLIQEVQFESREFY